MTSFRKKKKSRPSGDVTDGTSRDNFGSNTAQYKLDVRKWHYV